MRPFRIGVAVAALSLGGVAFAQVAPNPNLPGGGANVPPSASSGMTGTGPSSGVPPTSMGQGNVPPTSTSNVPNTGIGTSGTAPGALPSTSGNLPPTTLNQPSTTPGVPSVTLSPPATSLSPPTGALNPPSTTLGTPSTGTGLPSTTGPSNLGVPMGSQQPQQPTQGPGTIGGLPTTNP